MKKGVIVIISIAFLLVPGIVYPQSEQAGSKALPPVSQQLVPEGTFALKLAPALKLGAPESEIQAVDTLAKVGIAPKNGWIADYPVTPDIIGELEDSVIFAADSKRLPIEKEEALKAFQDVAAEFNLAVSPGDSGTYAEGRPQISPEVINNYYYEEGPPVVTYYPPAWDYYYLYSWVPYPFWWSGFYFGGFFVLHDFHRTVVVGHRKCLVSNHFFDHKTKGIHRVDPARRGTGEAFRAREGSRHRGFNTPEGKRGAESIFERSRERTATMRTGRESNAGTLGRPNTGDRSEQQRFTNRGNNTQSFDRRNDRSVRQPDNLERRNEMNSRVTSPREGRFSGDSSVTGERSFTSPSAGNRSFRSTESSGRSFGTSGKSFSAPSRGSGSACVNCHGGNSSFRGGGGGSSRSFSGMSFSRGGGPSGGGGGSSRSFSGGSSSRGGGGFSGGRGGGGRGR
jgi:hypothetical protein